MTVLNNTLTYSTDAYEYERSYRGPDRYASASDAIGCYLRMSAKLEGCPALDYERLGMLGMHVQTQPLPENPYYERVHDLLNVEAAIQTAKERTRAEAGDAAARNWRVWVEVQVEGCGLRGRAVSSTHAARIVRQIDAWLEEALAIGGLLKQDLRHELEEMPVRALAA